MTFLSVFLVSLVGSIGGVYLAKGIALRCNWLDNPNARSSHTKPVPRTGGIGMLMPLFFAGLVLALLEFDEISWSVPWGMAFVVALVSYFDDRMEVSRAFRFAFHGGVAMFVIWILSPGWVGQPFPLLGQLLPEALVGVMLFLWITGMINATNFMDGTDGIAGLFGLCVTFGYLTVFTYHPAVAESPDQFLTASILLIILMGSLLGFLFFNWSPATIFMGDSGSTFLGAFFAILPFALAYDGVPLDRALEAGFLFTWPFITDAGVTFARRVIRRERIFDAHRQHLYQVLAATFNSREHGHRIVASIYGVLAMIGIGLFWSSGPLWAKLAVCAWIWLALSAWTFGIRAKRAGVASSTGKVVPSPSGGLAELVNFEIYLSPPDVGQEEERMVREAFDSGFIAPVGPQLDAFEREFAQYLKVPQAHAVNSGTSAIHLALRALGVGPGDCVLCPDFTFIAAANPVRYLGAEPVLVDVERESWGMDPNLLEEAIETLKKQGKVIRAVVVVHAYGIPAPVERILEITHRHGIPVLEDCAGAVGSSMGSQHVGLLGDAATFSFNGNKILTTSGGGALIFKDQDNFTRSRSWANQGKPSKAIGYIHDSVGYNYKLSNVCAAIGLGQLHTLHDRLSKKVELRAAYEEHLKGYSELELMPDPAYGRRNNWLMAIGMPKNQSSMDWIMEFRRNGIEASPMWTPLHRMPFNRNLTRFGGTVADDIIHRFICLPSGSRLHRNEIQRICEVFKKLRA